MDPNFAHLFPPTVSLPTTDIPGSGRSIVEPFASQILAKMAAASQTTITSAQMDAYMVEILRGK